MTDIYDDWKLAGVNIIGTQHQAADGQCEDAWGYSRLNDDCGGTVLSACVCDGAGSADRGQRGAEVTCQIVSDWLANNYDNAFKDTDVAESLITLVTEAISKDAGQEACSLKSFACTLVAVAVSTDGSWIAAHLGDGAIVGILNNELRAVSLPQKGEFANETYFVTDDDAAAKITILRSAQPLQEMPTAMFLFSDGLEASLVNRHTGAVAPALKQMSQWFDQHSEEEVTEALSEQVATVFRERNPDDCTLVMLVATPNVNTDQIGDVKTVSVGNENHEGNCGDENA